ncbi:ASCH domain-containing protein [Brachybacterium sp. JHP9]|uniref:ASCH domain-containing protein n=1 Tax=Brachybacterium equifaecis TaxID=2910770 RepID=A0ABT0R2X1_9MICO|nr:ASCH domain-containing protein [Brachybacterium equifaecis]MCL6423813.1 ASCH domain-containing protein [Brachybacterium equifaecis]
MTDRQETPATVHVPGFGRIPAGEYGFPGPQRDAIVHAILTGAKSGTSSLLEEYRRADESLPAAGELEVVLDSSGRPVCVTRTSGVELLRLADVTDQHAADEGEGFADAAAWRRAHESFWTSPGYVEALGEPAIVIADDTQVVYQRFVVIARP